MNVALTTSEGRMAACFAGVELWIIGPDDGIETRTTVPTDGWSQLAWGRHLLQLDVTVLLCAGIDRFACGALQGDGVQVVGNAIGEPSDVLNQWRKGKLLASEAHKRGAATRGRHGARNRMRNRGGRRRGMNEQG